MFVTNHDHEKNWHTMPKNGAVKKVGKVLNSTFGVMSQIRRAKGLLSWRSWFDRHPFPILVKGLSRKHYIKTLIGHTTKVCMYLRIGLEHRLYQKTKGRRKEEQLGPVSSNCSTRDMLTEIIEKIIGSRSEMLCPSLFLSFDKSGVLSLYVSTYHCHMAHDDGCLWCSVIWKVCIRESEIDGDWSNDNI